MSEIVLEQPQPVVKEENKILVQVSNGLQAFNEKKKIVTDWATEAAKVTKPDDLNDKKAWDNVSRQRIDGKNHRCGIENDGKSIRKTIKEQLTNQISEKEKELVDIISPEEKRLQDMEDWRKQELARIEQEHIDAENKRIQDRLDALSAFGYSIDYADLKAMSEDTFSQYMAAAKVQFEKEKEDKAEAVRLQKEKEEAERIAQEEEQKKLAAERDELQKLRKEQADRQAEIDRQSAELQAERKRIADEKAAIETEKQNRIEAERREAELKKAQEYAEKMAKQQAIEDAKAEEQRKIEMAESDRKEAERQAALQPDKVKIETYILGLQEVAKPVLKSNESAVLMDAIQQLLNKTYMYAAEKLQSL